MNAVYIVMRKSVGAPYEVKLLPIMQYRDEKGFDKVMCTIINPISDTERKNNVTHILPSEIIRIEFTQIAPASSLVR